MRTARDVGRTVHHRGHFSLHLHVHRLACDLPLGTYGQVSGRRRISRMFRSSLRDDSMRFLTVDEDAVRIAVPDEAATAHKVQESVAIHAALGPIAIEARLKELDREIAAQKA